jgi:hypothetical protein
MTTRQSAGLPSGGSVARLIPLSAMANFVCYGDDAGLTTCGRGLATASTEMSINEVVQKFLGGASSAVPVETKR